MINIYGLRDWQRNLRYIGKTKHPLRYRWGQHVRAARKGRKGMPVYDWMRKLTEPPTIELIAVVPEDQWEAAERHWIAQARSLGCRLLNATDGGEGGSGNTGHPMLPHVREALRKAQVGSKRTAETKKLIGDSKRGKPMHPNTRAAIIKSATGRKKTQEQIEEIRARMLGSKASPEAIEKMAAAKRGKKQSPEAILKRSLAHLRRPITPVEGKATPFRGVSRNRKGFKAEIHLAGKTKNCGTFPTMEEAAHARDFAVLRHYAIGAVLNFPFIPEPNE